MNSEEKASLTEIIIQFVKFNAVGIPALALDYATLMLLTQVVGMDPTPAGAISFTINVITSYFLSMRFVFRHRDDLSRRREFAIFVAIALIGFCFNCAVMWLGTTLLGSGPIAVTLTKICAVNVVTLWNFFARRHWLDAGART